MKIPIPPSIGIQGGGQQGGPLGIGGVWEYVIPIKCIQIVISIIDLYFIN